MEFTQSIGIAGIGWAWIALGMTGLWLYQLFKGEADIVDFGWTAALGFLTLLYAFSFEGYFPRKLLLVVMVGLWAIRLGGYLLTKRVFVAGEDRRYVAIREKWSEHRQLKFFIFFQLQGVLAVILSIPFLVIIQNPTPFFGPGEVLGIFIWIIALAGEALADRQLQTFRENPDNKGRTCQVGLWHFSRHPNYFFEWLYWLSFVPFGLEAPLGWLTIISPLLMLYLILRVTGIPPNEAVAVKTRGEEYRDYQRRTSAFVPWFPKKTA